MRFRFDPNQEYQVHAIEAVCDLFKGEGLIVRDRALTDELAANLAPECRLKTI